MSGSIEVIYVDPPSFVEWQACGPGCTSIIFTHTQPHTRPPAIFGGSWCIDQMTFCHFKSQKVWPVVLLAVGSLAYPVLEQLQQINNNKQNANGTWKPLIRRYGCSSEQQLCGFAAISCERSMFLSFGLWQLMLVCSFTSSLVKSN